MPTNSKTKYTSLQFEETEHIVELVMTRMFEFLDQELIIARIIKSQCKQTVHRKTWTAYLQRYNFVAGKNKEEELETEEEEQEKEEQKEEEEEPL